MLTERQIDARRTGIGGSDMAAVLGIDPYKQSINVFFDKRPDLAQELGWVPDVVEGDAIDFGNYVEDPIAQLYAAKTGLKVRKSNVHHQHVECPWLLANIDRKVEGVKRGLEIKSVNWRLAHLWGEAGTDQVAEYYLPQIMHYMLVLDYPEWDAAVLIGGATDFRIYHIERDREWDDIILDGARDFWVNHVEAGIPPTIDLDHNSAHKLIRKVYHLVNDEQIELDASAIHWHEVLQQADSEAKRYKSIADNAKHHLQVLMGDAGRAFIPGISGAYQRTQRKRKGFTVEPTEFIEFRYGPKLK